MKFAWRVAMLLFAAYLSGSGSLVREYGLESSSILDHGIWQPYIIHSWSTYSTVATSCSVWIKRTGNVNSVLALPIHKMVIQTHNHFLGGAVVSVFVLSLQMLPCKRIPIFANFLVCCHDNLPALYDCIGALSHRCWLESIEMVNTA